MSYRGPTTNQDNFGAPSQSAYGRAFKRAHLIGKPTYLPDDLRGYPNYYGSIPGRPSIKSIPLFTPHGYAGELPLDQQPKIKKPYPWE